MTERRLLNVNGHQVVPLKSKSLHKVHVITFDQPPERITNAGQRAPYVTPRPYVRNDGHKDIQSLGPFQNA